MEKKNYTVTFIVPASQEEVFKQVNHVAAWWTTNLEGHSQDVNDVFTVRFAGMHVSTQKLIELIPDKKVVWLVTNSDITFIKNKNEWTNTIISFELSGDANQTEVVFTHQGLQSHIECYSDCSKGWDYFIKGSLFKLLTEGAGTPEGNTSSAH